MATFKSTESKIIRFSRPAENDLLFHDYVLLLQEDIYLSPAEALGLNARRLNAAVMPN